METTSIAFECDSPAKVVEFLDQQKEDQKELRGYAFAILKNGTAVITIRGSHPKILAKVLKELGLKKTKQ